MSTQARFWRGSARAVVGLVITGAAATAVVLLGSVDLPTVDRAPLALSVDTTQNTTHSVICSGSFGVLGADTSQPSVAIPTGASGITIAGTPSDTAPLTRAEGGEVLPLTLYAPNNEPLGAAQFQSIRTDTLRGTTASACTEPRNEQWLLGGGSALGMSTTLSLANPGAVPATVSITVFDESGEVAVLQSAGVLVAAGSEQTLSVNGYAPDRERLAVRVTSTGAPIAASLGVGHTEGITPFAVSWVTSQPEPATQLIVPGVSNTSDRGEVVGDAGEGDQYPVTVRVLAPGGEEGTAQVRAVDADGTSVSLGEIALFGSAIGELRVPTWPKGATAVVIDADVPVIGGVLGTAFEDDESDYEWFEPAPMLAADTEVGVPIVSGGQLVIVNPGDTDVKVTLVSSSGAGKTRTATIPAGAAVTQPSPADGILTSDGPVAAGVRIVDDGNVAGYPIQASDARDGALTVYTR